MSVILLVRHAQASWGEANYDQLSPTGHVQSVAVGRALAARGIAPSLLASGRMKRHRQTTEGMAEGAGWSLPASHDDSWDEFDHRQVLEVHQPPDTEGAAMSARNFQAWFEAATRRWASGDFDADYDESFGAFTDRVDEALDRTVAELGRRGTAVVVSSGGPISWVVARLLGGDASVWLKLNQVTVNAAVSKVVVGSRGSTLVSFNEHAHLEPEHVTYR